MTDATSNGNYRKSDEYKKGMFLKLLHDSVRVHMKLEKIFSQ